LLTPELKSLIAEKVAALRSEAGLATILDGIGEGFYAVDRDWRIILFNGEAARHFRCRPEDMLGRILWEAFPDARNTGLGQLFVKTMASRETIRSETESVIFGGRWLAYRLFPLGDGMGIVFRDTTDRKRAEEQRDLLITELDHRVKNTLATVQSIAAQTFRGTGIDPAVRRTFEARLITLSNVHGILTQQSWDSADLHDVVWSALRPHSAPDRERFTVEGPALRLGPKSAVALSMAVHELCTNAIKYGALSAETGHVDVRWSVAADRFAWQWRESGGPAVTAPTRTGFGARMIERALATQLSGKVAIAYEPAGVVCTIDAPLAAIRDGEA
jgi:two-component sensor histidine kinase